MCRKGEAVLGLFRVLIIGLFIFSIPVALITTNVRVALSEKAVYDYSVRTYDASARSGIPESELLRANGEIRRYLSRDDARPLAVTVRKNSGDQVSLFNAREIVHMADVRDLVRALFDVQVLAVAAVLTLAVIMLVLWPPRALAAAALYGSLLTGGVLAVAGVLAVSGFDAAWGQFHLIAFSNDLWKLNPGTDHLIQMFPEAFWERITTVIGGFTMLEALAIGSVSAVYLLRSRPRERGQAVRPAPLLPGPAGHSRSLTPPNPRHYVR